MARFYAMSFKVYLLDGWNLVRQVGVGLTRAASLALAEPAVVQIEAR